MQDARSPIQGAELWVPEGDRLVLRAGAYGPHTEFARVSARTRFNRGEGLPGAVWATEQALVWRDLRSHFVRAEYAAAAGIDAALGIPWFAGRELAGVITLLFTVSTPAAACVELWNHDEALHVLRHGGGLYAHAEEFARVSPLVQFPYAAGLPGMTWSGGIPLLVEDVRASSEFVRAELAARAGLKRAIGIPFYRERKVVQVVTFLGSESRPFVGAFELFVQAEQGLVSKSRFEEWRTEPAQPTVQVAPRAREILAREARYSRLPVISPGPPVIPPGGEEARSSILVTLPIHDGVRVRAVACLEF
jgi:hypothetical protein